MSGRLAGAARAGAAALLGLLALAGAALVALFVYTFFNHLAYVFAETRRHRIGLDSSSIDMTRELIATADKSAGFVRTSELSSRLCVVPEGSYPQASVERFFPGATISFVQNDDSNRYWFIIASLDESNSLVGIFAVESAKIYFPTSDSRPVHSFIKCVNYLRLDRTDLFYTVYFD